MKIDEKIKELDKKFYEWTSLFFGNNKQVVEAINGLRVETMNLIDELQNLKSNSSKENAVNISFLAGLIKEKKFDDAYESLSMLHRDLVQQGVVKLVKDF